MEVSFHFILFICNQYQAGKHSWHWGQGGLLHIKITAWKGWRMTSPNPLDPAIPKKRETSPNTNLLLKVSVCAPMFRQASDGHGTRSNAGPSWEPRASFYFWHRGAPAQRHLQILQEEALVRQLVTWTLRVLQPTLTPSTLHGNSQRADASACMSWDLCKGKADRAGKNAMELALLAGWFMRLNAKISGYHLLRGTE